jgi:hypothetical protein
MSTEKTLTEQEAIAIFGVDDEDLSEADTSLTHQDVTGDPPTVVHPKSSKKSKTVQEARDQSKKEMIATAKIQRAIENVHEARDRQMLAYQEETKVLQDRLESDRQALIKQLAEERCLNEQYRRQVDLLSASIPDQGSRAYGSQAAPINPLDTVNQPSSLQPDDMEYRSSEDESSEESDSSTRRRRWSFVRLAQWEEEQALQRQRAAEQAAIEKEEARNRKRHAQEQRKNTRAQSFRNSSKGGGVNEVDRDHPSFQNSSNNTDANADKPDNEPHKKRHKSQSKKSRKGKHSSSSSSGSSDSSSSSGSSDSSSQSDSSTEGRRKRKNKRGKSSRKFNVEVAASGNTELPKCPESEPIGHARLTTMKNRFDQIAVSATLSRRKIKSCFSLIQRDQMFAMVRLQLESGRPYVQEYLRGYDPRQIFKMRRHHLFKLLFAVYQPLDVQTVKDKNQRIINEIARIPLNLDGEWTSWFAFTARLTKVAVENGYKDLESFKDSMTVEQSTPLLRLLLGN